jgi:xanthine dehydrogenase YagR molybdenum-binding subunit
VSTGHTAEKMSALEGCAEERDDRINRLGVKGLGEIGLVGVPAAIANAVYHATGKRIRRFPITLDKLFA